MRFTLAALVAVTALGGASAQAAVLHDQLSTHVDDVNYVANHWLIDQRLEPKYSAYDVITVDDFTLNQAAKITTISAQFLGFGFNAGTFDPSDIQDYQIGIFSSPAAALASEVGDIASVTLPSSDLTITPYADLQFGVAEGYLARASVNFTLAAGTYWLGFAPRYDLDTGGQTYAIGDVGNFGPDAVQVNPGDGGGNSYPWHPPGLQMGFSIEGDVLSAAPEPASWALMIGGFGLAGATLRAQRRRVAA